MIVKSRGISPIDAYGKEMNVLTILTDVLIIRYIYLFSVISFSCSIFNIAIRFPHSGSKEALRIKDTCALIAAFSTNIALACS